MTSTTLLALLAAAALLAAIFFLLRRRSQLASARLAPPLIEKRQAFDLRNFRLEWDPENCVLTITHSMDGKTVWSSLPGEPFIAASLGREQVTEARGSYFFQDRIQSAWNAQTVEEFTGGSAGESYASVRGSLKNAGGQAIGYTLKFTTTGEHLAFELHLDDSSANRLFLTYASDPDERFFGFGEQFSHFDHKGKRVPIWTSEQGIGRGLQPLTTLVNLFARSGGHAYATYAPVPHYITSRLRSLFIENSEYAVFDLRRPDRVQLQVWSNRVRGCFLHGQTPAALISAYTEWAGRMRPLPDWILEGAVAGMQGGTDKVRQVLHKLQARRTPVAAFWLQDWVGSRATSFGKQLWWNWELDRDHYPGWEDLRAEMQQSGARLMLYASPFLADVQEKPNARLNLFHEASELGFLVKDRQGRPILVQNSSFSAGMVDLSNRAAAAWYRGILEENLLGAGASGWMADFGEALPYDCALSGGAVGPAFHNLYPQAWAQLNRELLDSAPGGDQLVFFMRSGFSRSPAYSTLFWAGDQLVSWDRHDGMKSAITGMLSGGISGFAFNHADIGGYTTIDHPLARYFRSKELLLRWMDFSAFTLIFRTHEGNIPSKNAQFYSDEETLAHFDRMARVYCSWGFYRKALAREASATGLPVMRHLFLHYPEDPEVYRLTYQQYLLGEDLLVAPVSDPGRSHALVYLPAHSAWTLLWTGQAFPAADKGRRVKVPAPIGQPPVLVRSGSRVGEQILDQLNQWGVRTGE